MSDPENLTPLEAFIATLVEEDLAVFADMLTPEELAAVRRAHELTYLTHPVIGPLTDELKPGPNFDESLPVAKTSQAETASADQKKSHG